VLVTSDTWGGIHFWKASTGELIREEIRHRSAAWVGKFSKNGRYLVSFSDDGTVQIWDIASGQAVGSLLNHRGSVVDAVFDPSDRMIATLTRTGQIRFWDLESSQPLTESMQHNGSSNFSSTAGGGVVFPLEFSPDGQFLKTRGGAPEVYRIWSVPPDGQSGPVPPWLLRLATICASKRLTDDGDFLPAADEVARMDEIRRALAAAPAEAPFVQWGRWFLSESPSRSIAPGFTVTADEAKRIAEEMRAAPPLITLNQRSDQMRSQRRWDEAIALDREAVALVRGQYGPESKLLSDRLFRLTQTLISAGRFPEAEMTARECLAMRTKFYYEDDWQTASTRALVGEAVSLQARHAEAEPILLTAYARINESNNAGVPARARGIAGALGGLYSAINQPDKASEWRRKAATPAPATQPASDGDAPAAPTPAP
jgi:hypothetical protein